MTRDSARPDGRRLRALRGAALLTLVCALPLQAEPEREAKEAELGRVRETIKGLREELSRARTDYDLGRQELAAIETRLGATARRLAELDAEMEGQRRSLEALGGERQRLTAAIRSQQEGLAAEMRAAYAMGRQDRLKLLLNQEDPARVGRMMAYYDYLSRERARRIDALSELHRQLDGVERELASQAVRLANLRSEESSRKAEQEADRRIRQGLLLRTKSEIGSKDRQLQALLKDESDLKHLVDQLGELLKDIPAELGKPFAKLRGRLPWPTPGPFLIRYGAPRSAEMVWQGVVIGGDEGAPVRAVADGRVAYADWLRGYGLFVILDHGDGYMSLYGYNQALYRSVGDWVAAGDVVATVGNSGGQEEEGLYFEIREQGRPVDPSTWCRQAARQGTP